MASTRLLPTPVAAGLLICDHGVQPITRDRDFRAFAEAADLDLPA